MFAVNTNIGHLSREIKTMNYLDILELEHIIAEILKTLFSGLGGRI